MLEVFLDLKSAETSILDAKKLSKRVQAEMLALFVCFAIQYRETRILSES